MSTIPNLDDLNQSVFSIPFVENDEDSDADLIHGDLEYDLRGGDSCRFSEYKDAWMRCLTKLKSIIHALHAPVASKVVQEVQSSYDDSLLGLPYPEVPVITITNPTSGSTFLNEVISQIDAPDLDNALFQAPSFTTQLYPTDCSNLSSLMKALISGFIDRPNIIEKIKGRSAASLANYDIEMLVAWYNAVRSSYDFTNPAFPKLVVLLHDFEQLDPLVIQDLLILASLYVPRLPLVFLLALSSPSSPSYLQLTYPRSTLALLRVRDYSVPSGSDVLQKVTLQLFFDLQFEPDVMIGPGIINFINDYITRQNASLESLITIFQLTYLKHFTLDPFTILIRQTPDLSRDGSEAFLDAVRKSFSAFSFAGGDDDAPSVSYISEAIDEARNTFHLKANRTRLGLRIIANVIENVGKRGHIPLNLDPKKGGINTLDLICDVLRNQAGPDIKLLGNSIKKLKPEHLADLLKTLKTKLTPLPEGLKSSDQETLQYITSISKRLNQDPEDGPQIESDFASWLMDYMKDVFTPLEKSTLWSVWYTGETEFPSELINPSLRASLMAGLSNPHDFCEPGLKANEDSSDPDESIWTYPDTSILFRRYLESGKMINIYDWFETFKLVLENQRDQMTVEMRKDVDKHKESTDNGSGRRKSTRVYGKGMKRGAVDMEVDEEGEEVDAQPNMEDEDEDAWKLQVQARFMRSFHELDYLGFIKHTGRKPDHVLRTVFDLLD